MTPKRDALDEQLAIFETFVDLAHEMGASKVERTVAAFSDDGRRVELFFSHGDFSGTRFGFRAKEPDADAYEEVWLAEELATGALHRIMRDVVPLPDTTGITWLSLHGQLLHADS